MTWYCYYPCRKRMPYGTLYHRTWYSFRHFRSDDEDFHQFTLAKNKPGWIDFNAGVIVENEPMEKTCERFIEYVIKVASGEFVNNEKKGYREIAIFKTGVTL